MSGNILLLGLWVKMLLANQMAAFFKMQYPKEEVNNEVYFWNADRHRSFLQFNTIILGLRSHTYPKYPK